MADVDFTTLDPSPAKLVFDGLWAMLEASPVFRALVPASLRLKQIGGAGDALKHGAQAADFPATMIVPVGGLTVRDWDSDGGHIKKRFRIKIATGEKQADHAIALEWEVFTIMAGWQAGLESLSWKGQTGFVKYCAVSEQIEEIGDQDMTYGETGWSVAWDGEVWMWIPKVNIVSAG